jgi:hypothetical protein
MGSSARGRNRYLAGTFRIPLKLFGRNMQTDIARAVLSVIRCEGEWAVELDGELFGHSHDREISKAAAHRRAREMHDAGRPCRVRVSGETGFFMAS